MAGMLCALLNWPGEAEHKAGLGWAGLGWADADMTTALYDETRPAQPSPAQQASLPRSKH